MRWRPAFVFEGRRAAGARVRARRRRTHRVRVDRRADSVRRTDQFAAAAEALGRRAGGGTARARHRGGARSAGRRREPAGSSGILFPGGLQGADHPVLLDQSVEPRADRRALAAAQGWPGRHQSFRDLRLHPQPRRAFPIPTSSIISCPWRWPTTARRWRRSTAFRRTSGPMRSQEPRLGAPGVGQSAATSRASCSIT